MVLRRCAVVAVSLAFVLPSSCLHAAAPVPYRFHHLKIEAGGFITGILFHPSVRGLAYVRTDIGGAYRWDARTARWTSLSESLSMADSNLLGIESMAVDPAHPDDLYLATGTYTHPGVPNGAILRSHDRGQTFERSDLPFQLGGNEPGRFAGERLAVDPAHDGVLYLGTRNNGLWRSVDHGAHWAQVQAFTARGDNGIGVVFVCFGPAAKDGRRPVYAGVSTHGPSLFVSRDDGASWAPVEGAPVGNLPYHAVFAADGSLYVTYGNNPGPNDVTAGAVYRWKAGEAWTDITPPQVPGQPMSGFAGLAVDARHPETVVVSTLDRWKPGDTLFRSSDRGGHWQSLSDLAVRDATPSPYLVHADGRIPFGHWIGAVAIDPFNGGHAFYGTGETLWQTADLTDADRKRPTHWTVGALGIEETAVIALLAPPSGSPLFAALGDIGCFRADTVAAGVEAVAFPTLKLSNCDSIAVAPKTPQSMAAVGRTWGAPHHGGYSTDGGHAWAPFPTEPADAAGGGSVALTADGRTILWSTHKAAFSSVDHGTTWSMVDPRPNLQIATDASARTYLLDAAQGRLDTVTLPPAGPAIALQPVASNLPPGSHLTIAGTDVNTLWIWGDHGLAQLDPAHGSLTALASVDKVYAFALGKSAAPGGPQAMYLAGMIGGQQGIYRSVDGGTAWQRIDDPSHGYGWITAIAADAQTFGRVYLGTNGLGVVVADPL